MNAAKVAEATHRTELSNDGYAKIEAKIQAIEALAYEGFFSQKSSMSQFQQILSETKKFRQILNEVLLIVPVNGE